MAGFEIEWNRPRLGWKRGSDQAPWVQERGAPNPVSNCIREWGFGCLTQRLTPTGTIIFERGCKPGRRSCTNSIDQS